MDTFSPLKLQRRLRRRLLDNKSTCCQDPALRDLAAYLLLYLGEPVEFWHIAAEWLREELDADRVDGGFCTPLSSCYQTSAESLRPLQDAPSMLDVYMDVRWPEVQLLLQSEAPVFLSSMEGIRTKPLQELLLKKGVRSKLAMSVQGRHGPVGIICADWLTEERRDAEQWLALRFRSTVEMVLSPVIDAMMAMTEQPELQHPEIPADALTPAEWQVANLVAKGLSYGEIANSLGRSLSTIDHQLRSIRSKLGAPSTARLVSLLVAAKSSRAL